MTGRGVVRAVACLTFLGLVACKRARDAPPRLAVVIVVDQLRADELTQNAPLWRGGLHRLLTEGRIYTEAYYTYGRTVTAAGHATIATGVNPRHHGVIDNGFYDRKSNKTIPVCNLGALPCDPNAALLAPTLGERLKRKYPAARVMALSQKGRSAALLGGPFADLIGFHAEDRLAITGLTHNQPGVPAWLDLFFNQTAGPDHITRIWELPNLPKPYADILDAAPGERDCGHGLTFPHELKPANDAALVQQWHCTPDSDRSIAETAIHVAQHENLGRGPSPDLLYVSFSATDFIGHSYGYESLERIAALTALDDTLTPLLDALAAQAGANLLVALTADHGVAAKIPNARAAGLPAARISEQSLIAQVAPVQVAHLALPYLYLKSPTQENIRQAAAALRKHPAVYAAWPTSELPNDSGPIARLMAESLYPPRAGDVTFVLRSYNYTGNDDLGAVHGTPWSYDRHVPLVLWTPTRDPAVLKEQVSVTDLTATLAQRLGLESVRADARGLPLN